MTEPQKELINMIKRQTEYSDEVILEKLKTHENNVERIILEYNGVENRQQIEDITTNQKIFKAIRDNMNQIRLNSES
tara:strand:- start:93 stop:323 length:231 start_codon:yes stop_codon:yes gene_type:complete